MYGQDPTALHRVMLCESSGDPNADNGICKGLFQFNPGTWASTPYASQSWRLKPKPARLRTKPVASAVLHKRPHL